jgi:hypothetical protein
MWLFTPFGFFSIVDKNDPKHPGCLCVRTRTTEDIVNLRLRYFEGEDRPMSPVESFVGTDYAYRVYVPRAVMAQVMWEITDDVDYTNFKSEVGKVQGHDRAHDYMGIWQIMMSVQNKARRKLGLDRRGRKGGFLA